VSSTIPGSFPPQSRPTALRAVLAALDAASSPGSERSVAPRGALPIIRPRSTRWASSSACWRTVPASRHCRDRRDTVLVAGIGRGGAGTRSARCAAASTLVMEGRGHKRVLRGAAPPPPGHHAEPAAADGVLPLQKQAIAAQRVERRSTGRRARRRLDFDVHHGNGTQAMFEDNPRLFYASTQ